MGSGGKGLRGTAGKTGGASAGTARLGAGKGVATTTVGLAAGTARVGAGTGVPVGGIGVGDTGVGDAGAGEGDGGAGWLALIGGRTGDVVLTGRLIPAATWVALAGAAAMRAGVGEVAGAGGTITGSEVGVATGRR